MTKKNTFFNHISTVINKKYIIFFNIKSFEISYLFIKINRFIYIYIHTKFVVIVQINSILDILHKYL